MGVIGNISMEEFAKQVYSETGVKPYYNDFALFVNTLYLDNKQLGKLFIYGSTNGMVTIKEIRKRNKISSLILDTHFIVIFNHDTQKPEIYVKNSRENVIKQLADRNRVCKATIGDGFLLIKADKANYLLTKEGYLKRLRVPLNIHLDKIWVKRSNRIDGYEVYSSNYLLYFLDNHLNKLNCK